MAIRNPYNGSFGSIPSPYNGTFNMSIPNPYTGYRTRQSPPFRGSSAPFMPMLQQMMNQRQPQQVQPQNDPMYQMMVEQKREASFFDNPSSRIDAAQKGNYYVGGDFPDGSQMINLGRRQQLEMAYEAEPERRFENGGGAAMGTQPWQQDLLANNGGKPYVPSANGIK